jgi:hypothetical protein
VLHEYASIIFILQKRVAIDKKAFHQQAVESSDNLISIFRVYCETPILKA